MRAVAFIGSSRDDLRSFPEGAKEDIGYALHQIQLGATPACAKPLKGLGSGILEIVGDFRGDAYRAVYTVKFREIIYVLHCFQKKSKRGIGTPMRDLSLIKLRLKQAEADYAFRYRTNKSEEAA